MCREVGGRGVLQLLYALIDNRNSTVSCNILYMQGIGSLVIVLYACTH